MRPSSLLPAPMTYKVSLVPEETWTSESAPGTGLTAGAAETSKFLLSGLKDNKHDGRWSQKKSGLAMEDEEQKEETS